MNKEAFINHDHDWYDTDEETPMDAMNLKLTRYGWSKDKLNLRKITMKDSSCKKNEFCPPKYSTFTKEYLSLTWSSKLLLFSITEDQD